MTPTTKYVHQIRCACFTNGCTSTLAWEDNLSSTQYANVRLLQLNGWQLDHDRWICGLHPKPIHATVAEHRWSQG